jgi:HEAT repeat protein
MDELKILGRTITHYSDEVVAWLAQQLLDTNHDTQDEMLRGNLAYELGSRRIVAAIPALMAALKDENDYVRVQSAWALGTLKAVEATSALIDLLQDEDGWVRGNAVYALGGIATAETIQPIIQCLNDENREVRENATFAFNRLTDKGVGKQEIIAAFASGTVTLTYAAMDAFRNVAYLPECFAILLDATNHSDATVRSVAANSLGSHPQQAYPRLLELLSDPAESVRAAAAQSLGEIGNSQAIVPILHMLHTTQWDFKPHCSTVEEALQKLGHHLASSSL